MFTYRESLKLSRNNLVHKQLSFNVSSRVSLTFLKMVETEIGNNNLTKKAATVQVIVSLLASLSVTSSGIGFGFPAITSQLLSQPDGDIVLNQSEISWFASITAICCPIGSLLSGYLSEKIGRRLTLMLVNIVAIISWLIIGFSSREDVVLFFIELMIGRALIGITIGMITAPTVMFCSEVCHPKIRGRMTVMSTPFFISFGSLIAYLLGYWIPNDFRLVSFIAAGMTVVTFVALFFIPESPTYLVTKKKIDAARSALVLLRALNACDSRIDSEIKKIEASSVATTEQQSFLSNLKEFGKPELYKPFLIMISFFAVQQFCGIFVILVYAAQFSIEAGVTSDAFLSSVIIGVIRCVTTFLVGLASVNIGKKPMAISSAVGMFLGLVGIILCAVLSTSEGNLSWLPAVFLFIYLFSGTIGFLTLPFAMVAEMYPQKSRGFAAGITMCLAYIMSFVNVKIFFTVFEYFGNVVVFSFYSVVSVAGILFAIFILPETKGKTLQEIEQYFENK